MSFRILHPNLELKVWSSRGTWFWHLSHPTRNMATVGAAATEAEAMREVCVALEERSGQLLPAQEAAALCLGLPA
jgi:hypothetical protein